jgi:hypothetical protein
MWTGKVRSLAARAAVGGLLLALAPCAASARPAPPRPEVARPPAARPDAARPDLERASIVRPVNTVGELEGLLGQYRASRARAAETATLREELFKQGLVSRREVDDGHATVAAWDAKIAEVERKITGPTAQVAGVAPVPTPSKTMPANSAVARAGSGHWSLADAGKIEGFFSSRFGRQLPISAFGQSKTHTDLGWDHRNAMDVALSPNSAEGKALIDYLRDNGIPYLTFEAAKANVATGAHIHIGLPSHRL